jgi:hypothetical protein
MNWINIHTETLRGEEFIGAEPLERATWLNLLGWSCAQENDGIIEDCKSWGNRKWQQLCGVTKEEVDLNSELYHFDGDNLVVNFYPIEQQAAVKAKRASGRKGGRPKKQMQPEPLKNKDEKPHGYVMDNHMGNHKDKDTLNEKERKVIVKERKGKESLVSIETRELLAELWKTSPKRARDRSSKKQVFNEWKKIKTKPDKKTIVTAINAWIACHEWTRDNGQAIQGLHLWIKNERWESLPEKVINMPTNHNYAKEL